MAKKNKKSATKAKVEKNAKTAEQMLENEEQQAVNPIDVFNRTNGIVINSTEDTENTPKQTLDIIGEEQIKQATETLKKYKTQKQNLDQRIIANEQWWKLRNWEQIKKDEQFQPNSGWLFNSIMNKLADFSDNYPEPNIRARTQADSIEADRLKNVIPMILKRNRYSKTYDETSLSKLKSGTSMTGVFWNKDKDGIGDVEIVNIDMLSIYWQPGITDIQKSRNVFTVELADTDLLKKQYPQFEEEISSEEQLTLAKYIYEDKVDTTNKSCIIDWYYKRDGKLHYCKYVNNVVLLSTENELDTYPNGLYDDGNYPFVPDALFKMEGTIAGFGYIDVGKSPQEYIDLLDSAIIKNTLMKAHPRYFERHESSINREQFLDWSNPIVECSSNLGVDDLREITVGGLDSSVFNQRDAKINELKETTGNRDVSTGGTTSGVTAASAISALIETGSKGSRYAIKGTYEAFERIIYLIIERIRQFYNLPRFIRITDDDGTESFGTYSNAGITLQTRENPYGGETKYLPEFDIEVTAQKASPYSKASQNELALQFYQFGFFNPQNTDATLACLNMMDFDHKSDIIKQVKQNGTLLDALQQAQMQLQQQAEQIQKLQVMCDLYVPGSNLTGSAQPQQSAPQSKMDSADVPNGMQSAIELAKGKGSLAEQSKEKASTAAQPR